MTTPRTAIGRDLVAAVLRGETPPIQLSIAAIEAEAEAVARADLRTEVQALLDTLAAIPHDDHASPCTACLRDGFARTLDLLSP